MEDVATSEKDHNCKVVGHRRTAETARRMRRVTDANLMRSAHRRETVAGRME